MRPNCMTLSSPPKMVEQAEVARILLTLAITARVLDDALGSFLGSYAVGYLTGLTGDPTSSYVFMGASLLVSVLLASSVKRPKLVPSQPLAPVR